MKEYNLGIVLQSQDIRVKHWFELMIETQLPEIELVFDRHSVEGFEYEVSTDSLDNIFALGMAVSIIYERIKE